MDNMDIVEQITELCDTLPPWHRKILEKAISVLKKNSKYSLGWFQGMRYVLESTDSTDDMDYIIADIISVIILNHLNIDIEYQIKHLDSAKQKLNNNASVER
jgi:hypothetical protein